MEETRIEVVGLDHIYLTVSDMIARRWSQMSAFLNPVARLKPE